MTTFSKPDRERGMKERPILFSGRLPQLVHDGLKTQTRRSMKTQPLDVIPMKGDKLGVEWIGLMKREPEPKGVVFRCRLGKPGDRLWVKETFYAWGCWEIRYSEKKRRDEWHFVDQTQTTGRQYLYEPPAGYAKTKRCTVILAWWKRPAIFMPRAACRSTLEIVSVRAERLNDIGEADAKAEGAPLELGQLERTILGAKAKYKSGFCRLWESINGAGSWAANPWVWVIEFKRVQT